MKEFVKISVTPKVHYLLKKDKIKFNLKSLSAVIEFYKSLLKK